MRKYIHLIKLEKQKNRGGEILLKILNFKNVNLFLQNSIFMKVKDFFEIFEYIFEKFRFRKFSFRKNEFRKKKFRGHFSKINFDRNFFEIFEIFEVLPNTNSSHHIFLFSCFFLIHFMKMNWNF